MTQFSLINRNERRLYKVLPDQASGSWVLRSEGLVLRRMRTKQDLVREAGRRARSRGNSIVEIRRQDGTVEEYRRFLN